MGTVESMLRENRERSREPEWSVSLRNRLGFNPARGEGSGWALRSEISGIKVPVVASGSEHRHTILTAALVKTDTEVQQSQSALLVGLELTRRKHAPNATFMPGTWKD